MIASKPKKWQTALGLASLAVILVVMALGIFTASAGPSKPRPMPTPIPETRVETSVIEAEGGITCVRVHQGEKTLHWECLR